MKLLVPPSFSAAAQATVRTTRAPPPPGTEPHVARVRRVMATYARDFAGRSRASCDPAQLRELVGALETARQGLVGVTGPDRLALAGRVAEVDEHLSLLTAEVVQVELSLRSEATDRGAAFADRLNGHVSAWRRLVEGGHRLARREGLLRRLLEQVEAVAAQLDDPGLDSAPFVAENRAWAAAVLERMEAELDALILEQAGATVAERIDALALEAADAIELYRVEVAAHPRERWAAATVALVCDRLGEVERQVQALADAGGDAAAALLRSVQPSLDAYETVWSDLSMEGR